MHALVTYLKNVRAELVHVTWPSRRQALAHTLLVIALSLLTALLIALFDALFTGAVSRLVG